MVRNNNNIYGRKEKKAGKKHCALNPSLRGGVGGEGAGCSFQAGTQRYHFSSPSLLLFYPAKKRVREEKIASFEDCQLPTTIICL